MLRMLLTRHGQSEWNARGRWQGQADPPLSDLGRRQAGVAAERIGAVDAVVASDLIRAHETAVIIAELLGEGPVLVEGELRERDAGEWSGLTKAQIEEQWPGYLAEGRRPPAFEDEAPFLERVLRGLTSVVEQVGDGDVLVVTHGGVIYALERHLTGGEHPARIPNLGARWVEHDGELGLGERIILVDPDEITVPQQL